MLVISSNPNPFQGVLRIEMFTFCLEGVIKKRKKRKSRTRIKYNRERSRYWSHSGLQRGRRRLDEELEGGDDDDDDDDDDEAEGLGLMGKHI